MAEYGIDVSTYPDLDRTGRTISGARVLAEHMARLIETDPTLLDWDVEQPTLDIIDYLSIGLDPEDLRRIETDIAGVWSADERVASATVTATQIGEMIQVVGEIKPIDGKTFSLVLSATAAGVAIVSVQ